MAIRDLFKVNLKTFFNPGAWIDYEGLKYTNRIMGSALRPLFTPAKAEREETFVQAMERLGLSEADVMRLQKTYFSYTLLFFFCGLAVFFYSFYLLFSKEIWGFLLGIGSSSLFFSQAFRFDFWGLQLSERKLGLTLNDWKRSRLGFKGAQK